MLINSSGGSADILPVVQEQVKELSQLTHLRAINMCEVSSAAFWIYMMFPIRVALPGSTFLIHSFKYSYTDAEATDIIKNLTRNVELEDTMIDEFLARFFSNKRKRKELKKTYDLGADIIFQDDEAREIGFVNA